MKNPRGFGETICVSVVIPFLVFLEAHSLTITRPDLVDQQETVTVWMRQVLVDLNLPVTLQELIRVAATNVTCASADVAAPSDIADDQISITQVQLERPFCHVLLRKNRANRGVAHQ